MWPRLWVGRVDDARRQVDVTLPRAEQAGHIAAVFLGRRSRILLDFVADGDLGRFADRAAEGVDFSRTNRLRWLADAYVFSGLARFWQGDWDGAADHLRAATTTPVPAIYAGRYSAPLLTFLAWAGEAEAFDRLLAELRSTFASMGVERTLGTLSVDLAEVEGLALLGREVAAARRYPKVAAILRAGVVLRPPDLRVVQAVAGLAAGLAEDPQASAAHFAEARLVTASLQPRQLPDVDLLQGLAACGMGGGGDVERARRLLASAIAGYRDSGMPGHLARAEALLSAI